MSADTHKELTLGGVLDEIETWRAQKNSQGEAIPELIWDKFFLLHQHHDVRKLRAVLGISKEQYERKSRERAPARPIVGTDDQNSVDQQGTADGVAAEQELVTVCEVKTQLPYEPQELPKPTDCMVIECHKPDGCVMKFHTTATKLRQVLREFLDE